MVTREGYDRNRTMYRRYKVERTRCTAINTVTVFLLGLGILVLVLGPCAGLYSIGLGFVGLVASWVLGLTLRAYLCGRQEDESTIDYYV
jgi:hypothetical protein